MVEETAGQEFRHDYYYLLSTLYHTRTAVLLSTTDIIYFEHYYIRTAMGRR